VLPPDGRDPEEEDGGDAGAEREDEEEPEEARGGGPLDPCEDGAGALRGEGEEAWGGLAGADRAEPPSDGARRGAVARGSPRGACRSGETAPSMTRRAAAESPRDRQSPWACGCCRDRDPSGAGGASDGALRGGRARQSEGDCVSVPRARGDSEVRGGTRSSKLRRWIEIVPPLPEESAGDWRSTGCVVLPRQLSGRAAGFSLEGAGAACTGCRGSRACTAGGAAVSRALVVPVPCRSTVERSSVRPVGRAGDSDATPPRSAVAPRGETARASAALRRSTVVPRGAISSAVAPASRPRSDTTVRRRSESTAVAGRFSVRAKIGAMLAASREAVRSMTRGASRTYSWSAARVLVPPRASTTTGREEIATRSPSRSAIRSPGVTCIRALTTPMF
jgi:hypothetical protein